MQRFIYGLIAGVLLTGAVAAASINSQAVAALGSGDRLLGTYQTLDKAKAAQPAAVVFAPACRW